MSTGCEAWGRIHEDEVAGDCLRQFESPLWEAREQDTWESEMVTDESPRSRGESCERQERSRNKGLRLRGFATRWGGDEPSSSASACGHGLDDFIMMDCSSRLAFSESQWTLDEMLSVAILNTTKLDEN
jgi:hypothetical protein